jgi:hypothetical protein
MVGHNTYEIWGGLKLLKGIFGGKSMYTQCTANVQSPNWATANVELVGRGLSKNEKKILQVFSFASR